MFLNASGDKVGEPGGRSVEAFGGTLNDLKALDAIRARVAKGEKGLTPALLLREMSMGAVSFADASSRRASLEKPKNMKKKAWKELLADIDGQMVNLEVGALLEGAGRDSEKHEALKATFYAMAKEGKVATGDSLYPFWSSAMEYAKGEKDAAVFGAGLKALEEEFGSNPRARPVLDKMKAELEEMAGVSQVEAPEAQTVVLTVSGMT
jgi:hypothetical protein